MAKKREQSLRLDPEQAICPLYDSTGIRMLGLPEQDMGVAVVDDCPQEHIQ